MPLINISPPRKSFLTFHNSFWLVLCLLFALGVTGCTDAYVQSEYAKKLKASTKKKELRELLDATKNSSDNTTKSKVFAWVSSNLDLINTDDSTAGTAAGAQFANSLMDAWANSNTAAASQLFIDTGLNQSMLMCSVSGS